MFPPLRNIRDILMRCACVCMHAAYVIIQCVYTVYSSYIHIYTHRHIHIYTPDEQIEDDSYFVKEFYFIFFSRCFGVNYCQNFTHHAKPAFVECFVNRVLQKYCEYLCSQRPPPRQGTTALLWLLLAREVHTLHEGVISLTSARGVCSAFSRREAAMIKVLSLCHHPGPPLRWQRQSGLGDQCSFSVHTCPLFPGTFARGDNWPGECPQGTLRVKDSHFLKNLNPQGQNTLVQHLSWLIRFC